MAEAKEESQSQTLFTTEISVKEEKLWAKVTEIKSKRIFQSSFTSKQLITCGFNQEQAENLDSLHRFMETGKANKDGLELSIAIIKQDDTDDIKEDQGGDNELEEGIGVQGVYITAAAPKHKQPTSVDVAQIMIAKKDNFFGSLRFIMNLQEMQREENEINKEIMEDIKNEIKALNNKLAKSRDWYFK